ncbi:unnamed protein product [Trichobilharzia szidati]|nr:unnamed protein product [Trichobilharzia szidati]
MDVFLCTVLLALLQANLGVHSFSVMQNAETTPPAVGTPPADSQDNKSVQMEVVITPNVTGDAENTENLPGEEKPEHIVKVVDVAVQTPPEFYKPKTLDDTTLAFYKTVVKIMERLSEAFHKIYRDVEKFKRKLKPNRS